MPVADSAVITIDKSKSKSFDKAQMANIKKFAAYARENIDSLLMTEVCFRCSSFCIEWLYE